MSERNPERTGTRLIALLVAVCDLIVFGFVWVFLGPGYALAILAVIGAFTAISWAQKQVLVRTSSSRVLPEDVGAVRVRLHGARVHRVVPGPDAGQVRIGWTYQGVDVSGVGMDGESVDVPVRTPEVYDIVAYLGPEDVHQALAARTAQEFGSVDAYSYVGRPFEEWELDLADLEVDFPSWRKKLLSGSPSQPGT